MRDGVADDVGDVVVGEGVHDLLALALGAEQAGVAEHPQVLGDEGLVEAESLGDLVDAPRPGGEQIDDRHAMRVGQRLQQIGSGDESARLGHPDILAASEAVRPRQLQDVRRVVVGSRRDTTAPLEDAHVACAAWRLSACAAVSCLVSMRMHDTSPSVQLT